MATKTTKRTSTAKKQTRSQKAAELHAGLLVRAYPETERICSVPRKQCLVCGKPMSSGQHAMQIDNPSPQANNRKWVHADCVRHYGTHEFTLKHAAELKRVLDANPSVRHELPADPFDFDLHEYKQSGKPIVSEPTTEPKPEPIEPERTGKLWMPEPEDVEPTAKPTPINAANASTALTDALAAIIGSEFETRISELDAKLEALIAKHSKHIAPRELLVKIGDQPAKKIDGVTHERFDFIIKLAAARKNILLVGPTGCGKTHLCKQVADALGLQFRHVSCSGGLSEGHLYGRLLPCGTNGTFEFVGTDFLDCYENGGVFLFDELDAADENTLIAINTAIANGIFSVPNRPEKPVATRHPDFVCIAAANTFGTGASRQYVGRNRLDEATLDRFRIGTIEMDYSDAIEAALCPDDELRNWLVGIRNSIRENSLERIVSTRFMADAYDIVHRCNGTLTDVHSALFSGWRPDELRRVKSYADLPKRKANAA